MGKESFAYIDELIQKKSSAKGRLKTTFTERIEFKNVNFAYPSNPDQMVLRNVNLTIEKGERVALVGLSGSGKTTVIQLIEQFYDPISGDVFIDNYPMRSISSVSLRNLIGLVP